MLTANAMSCFWSIDREHPTARGSITSCTWTLLINIHRIQLIHWRLKIPSTFSLLFVWPISSTYLLYSSATSASSNINAATVVEFVREFVEFFVGDGKVRWIEKQVLEVKMLYGRVRVFQQAVYCTGWLQSVKVITWLIK